MGAGLQIGGGALTGYQLGTGIVQITEGDYRNGIANVGSSGAGVTLGGVAGRAMRYVAVTAKVAGKADDVVRVARQYDEAYDLGAAEIRGVPALDDVAYVQRSYWPPNRGFAGTPVTETLKPGTMIDRYGYPTGTFASPAGTPAQMRSLAPGVAERPLNTYRVVKPLNVQSGRVAPWFGQPGGGTQYELPESVESLIRSGHLERVCP